MTTVDVEQPAGPPVSLCAGNCPVAQTQCCWATWVQFSVLVSCFFKDNGRQVPE